MKLQSDPTSASDKSNTAKPSCRTKQPPVALRDYVIMSSTGSGSSSTEITESLKTVTRREMYAVIDRMIAELDRRFTDNEVQLAACDTIFPGSPNFLNFELMAPLAKQFGPNLSIDSDKLKPQIAVISEMLKGIKLKPQRTSCRCCGQ